MADGARAKDLARKQIYVFVHHVTDWFVFLPVNWQHSRGAQASSSIPIANLQSHQVLYSYGQYLAGISGDLVLYFDPAPNSK
jgi:hypothetical protein